MFQYVQIILFFWLVKLLKYLYPKSKIYRLEECLKSYFESINQNNSDSSEKIVDFIYPGITQKPWYEPENYNVLKFISHTLKIGFKDIENEWLNYLSSGKNIIPKYKVSEVFTSLDKNQDDDWQYYLIWRQGKFTDAGLALFPQTVQIISKLEPFLYSFGEVVFIVMKPGIVLPPHKDDINISLTCHLGIRIPEDCAIKVGGETRIWDKGKTLFFDNNFEHSAWNLSQENRVVLLLDLYHPELTKLEQILFHFLMKHSSILSESGGFHGIQDPNYQKQLLANIR